VVEPVTRGSTHAADRPPAISAREALEVLTRAGAVLTGSLAFEETLRNGVQLAVPAIADWAAVLVMRDDGSEREITSHHPDPEVEGMLLNIRRRRRQRPGGGSESLQVLHSGEPVLATDVSGALAADISPEERETIERLAPRSYMLVPLRARGRVLGSFTLLSTQPGRHYTPADLSFAQTLAGRFALAIDNARLYEAASRSLGLLDTVFASAPVGLAFLDVDRCYARINEALAAMNGHTVDEHVGRDVEEVGGDLAAPLADAYRTVVETGRALLDQETSSGDGAEIRHWVSSFTPVRGLDGELLGVGVVVIDVTDRRRLLEAEQLARSRADVLARAGAVLDSSLHHEQTLRNLADIAVPDIADWCSIRTLDAEGDLRHVTTMHVDPAKRAIADDYERRYPPQPSDPGGAFGVLRSGQSLHVPEITDEMLVAAISDAKRLELIRALGLRSVVIAPLMARGRTVGLITLATAESGRVFGAADVQLAEELGRRAGVAIDNARLYSERARIAHTLQARLLPGRLPDIPGASVAARYRAAGELNEVGGDFYDVFARGDGAWVLMVGDVSGKGAEAAAVTALARYTLRTATMDAGPPSRALRRLNSAMLTESDAGEFVTVALVYATPAAGGAIALEIALAGHPPPLLRGADGRVSSVGAPGSMLGVATDPQLVDVTAVLAPGDLALLYTDGVTEAGPRNAMLGEEGLVRLVRASTGADVEDLVRRVEAAAVGAQPGEPRDDIALLAIAATG
jgi:GAF domain-containing protein